MVLVNDVESHASSGQIASGARITEYSTSNKVELEWRSGATPWTWGRTEIALEIIKVHFGHPRIPYPATVMIRDKNGNTLDFSMKKVPTEDVNLQVQDPDYADLSFRAIFDPQMLLSTTDTLMAFQQCEAFVSAKGTTRKINRGRRKSFTVGQIRVEFNVLPFHGVELPRYAELGAVLALVREYIEKQKGGQWIPFFGDGLRSGKIPYFLIQVMLIQGIPDYNEISDDAPGTNANNSFIINTPSNDPTPA